MNFAQTGPVELGAFDLSRIPGLASVDPEKIQQAVSTIEESVEQQVAQLEQDTKRNNNDKIQQQCDESTASSVPAS
jgi:hypothetical protein